MKEEKYFYKRNIILSYINGALMWGRFFIPVLALFYIASQVPLEQFSIIMAVFAFTTLILEIPTGVLADLLGKKKTLLLSRLMYIIEIAILAFFNGFWMFLIAKIISGVGVSLSSGTGSAMLYDSLKKLRKQKDYKKIAGNLVSISNISMAIVFIIGAYLFTLNPKLPAFVSLPFIIVGFFLTFLMKEPYISKKRLTLQNSWKHLKEGISCFVKHPYIKYLSFFYLACGAVISMMLSLSSAYFAVILIPISSIGIISFAGSMLTAFSSKFAHKLENLLGKKKSLMLVQIGLISSIALMSLVLPYLGLIFFLFIQLISGFSEVILGEYVNRHIKSSHRATILSIHNMFDNLGITLLFPILGYLIKLYSFKFSLMLLTIFLIVYLIIISVGFKGGRSRFLSTN